MFTSEFHQRFVRDSNFCCIVLNCWKYGFSCISNAPIRSSLHRNQSKCEISIERRRMFILSNCCHRKKNCAQHETSDEERPTVRYRRETFIMKANSEQNSFAARQIFRIYMWPIAPNRTSVEIVRNCSIDYWHMIISPSLWLVMLIGKQITCNFQRCLRVLHCALHTTMRIVYTYTHTRNVVVGEYFQRLSKVVDGRK